MSLISETTRLLRHTIAPVVVLAVERGWLPESVANDVTEVAVICGSVLVALLFSWLQDRRK